MFDIFVFKGLYKEIMFVTSYTMIKVISSKVKYKKT